MADAEAGRCGKALWMGRMQDEATGCCSACVPDGVRGWADGGSEVQTAGGAAAESSWVFAFCVRSGLGPAPRAATPSSCTVGPQVPTHAPPNSNFELLLPEAERGGGL